MKLFSILSAFLLFSLSLTACVTTREQLNEQRGITSDDSTAVAHEKPIQSEDLKEPEVVAPNTSAATTPESAIEADKANSAVTHKSTPMTAEVPSNTVTASSQTSAVPMAASGSATLLKGDLSSYGVDELRVEVARLNGVVEELEHEKTQSDQTHKDEMKKADDHIAELEKKLKELQPDAPVVPEGQTPLMAGKEAFLNAKYDDAILFMGQVLEKQDSGKDAEEAVYTRGESYFKKQQYNKAIVDFSRFSEKFQKSSYHPKALLRIAECFEAMGRKDDAKAFYSDLLEKFPKTAEGKLAKKRLKAK